MHRRLLASVVTRRPSVMAGALEHGTRGGSTGHVVARDDRCLEAAGRGPPNRLRWLRRLHRGQTPVTRPQRSSNPSSATSWTPEIGLEICAVRRRSRLRSDRRRKCSTSDRRRREHSARHRRHARVGAATPARRGMRNAGGEHSRAVIDPEPVRTALIIRHASSETRLHPSERSVTLTNGVGLRLSVLTISAGPDFAGPEVADNDEVGGSSGRRGRYSVTDL